MSVFAVDIEKKNGPAGDTHWTNSYHVTCDDLGTARLAADALVSFELQVHTSQVYFTKMRVSTVTPDDGVFVSIPLNAIGSASREGEGLPLFLAVRTDFVPDVGRAGRKFYHTLDGETDQGDGEWSGTIRDRVADNLTDLFAALASLTAGLCNKTGSNSYSGGTVYTTVTQHQFRRGSKRRVPILP